MINKAQGRQSLGAFSVGVIRDAAIKLIVSKLGIKTS